MLGKEMAPGDEVKGRELWVRAVFDTAAGWQGEP